MKKILVILFLLLSQTSNAAISNDVVISGYVTKILDKKIVLYVEGRLMNIPKQLIKRRVKIGEEIQVATTLSQMRKIAKTSLIAPVKKKKK